MRMLWPAFAIALLLPVAGFAQHHHSTTTETKSYPPASAVAYFTDETGNTIGNADLYHSPHGTLIDLTLNLPAGGYALHIHEKGSCTPDFNAAGGHLNPEDRNKHGYFNPAGYHLGDLPNIFVNDGGLLRQHIFIPHLRIKTQLLDRNGSSFMIHAGLDDYQSDPAGNSGARIACAVITPKQ